MVSQGVPRMMCGGAGMLAMPKSWVQTLLPSRKVKVMPWVIVKAWSMSTAPRRMGTSRRNGCARFKRINSSTRELLTMSISAAQSLSAVTFHSVRPSIANSRVTCEVKASAMFSLPVRRALETRTERPMGRTEAGEGNGAGAGSAANAGSEGVFTQDCSSWNFRGGGGGVCWRTNGIGCLQSPWL